MEGNISFNLSTLKSVAGKWGKYQQCYLQECWYHLTAVHILVLKISQKERNRSQDVMTGELLG